MTARAFAARPASSTAIDRPLIPALAPLARAGVFLALAMSGVVFTEPAPVDLVMLVLIALLPLAGLTALSPGMTFQLLLLLGCGAGALVAATLSRDLALSTIHTGVSFYLHASFIALAAFIARDPERHTHLVMRAWVIGAVIAGGLALAGYFNLFPGANELFTKYGRASGTFKDPNVLGPFLVPPILYLAHRALDRFGRGTLLDISVFLALTLAILLSFSRGAWLQLAFAILAYGFLRLVAERTPADRARLLIIAALGLSGLIAGLMIVMQFEQVSDLLAERSSLTHDYDVGPEGRFGGHWKALGLVLANPLGIGALQFAQHFHPEDVHNVYLSMFLNAGWFGGLLYIGAVASTLVAGYVHLAHPSPTRMLFLIAYAAFLANAVEGIIIDTDHWRHFYVLMAIIWGMIGARELETRGKRS